jgi:hypothetical protein
MQKKQRRNYCTTAFLLFFVWFSCPHGSVWASSGNLFPSIEYVIRELDSFAKEVCHDSSLLRLDVK